MNTAFCEITQDELLSVEGGNPVVVYGVIAVGKYVVVPAVKILAEAAVTTFIFKAVEDLVK